MLNPLARPLAGFVGPSLLETTGRRTGRKRRTPVGASLREGAYWVVAEHGRHAAYVKNIEAEPRVRLRHRGRWRDAWAELCPDEDPRRHARGLNGAIVRLVGTDLLVIRIQPDPR